jgi:hydroxylamine reductase (hybrid-cluster protein)
MTPEGFIAFQVHGIFGKTENVGKEIWWRNIRIKTENLEAERMQGPLAPEVNCIPNTLTEAEDGIHVSFANTTIPSNPNEYVKKVIEHS